MKPEILGDLNGKYRQGKPDCGVGRPMRVVRTTEK